MADIYDNDPNLKKSFADLGNNSSMAMGSWLNGAMNYDPQAAVNASAMGAYNSFKTNLKQDIGDLRGQEVGMGRLDSGYATKGEDRLVTAGINNLNNTLASNSLQAEGLKLQNQGQLGSFAQQGGQDYRQGISDLNATKRQQDLMAQASKRSMWGQIAGGVLGAAGTVLGGPIGAALVGGGAKKLATA